MVLSLTLLASVIVLGSFAPFVCKKGGITGKIYLVAGNQMPNIGQPLPGKTPLQTTLYIYELTNINQVTRADVYSSFYKSINTKLVKKIQSGKNGAFKVKLPPGQYSLFVKKDSLFYANIFDGNNNINPVTVEKGKYTEIEVRADYDAVY